MTGRMRYQTPSGASNFSGSISPLRTQRQAVKRCAGALTPILSRMSSLRINVNPRGRTCQRPPLQCIHTRSREFNVMIRTDSNLNPLNGSSLHGKLPKMINMSSSRLGVQSMAQRASGGASRRPKKQMSQFPRKRNGNNNYRQGRNGTEEEDGNLPVMNESILSLADRVRLVDSAGDFLGETGSVTALAKARDEGEDLVMIQDGDIPVCKIISYSKFKYQKDKALKEMRKKNRTNKQDVKELKMRVGIAEHDYQVRMRAAKKFLQAGDKVKMSIQFRGREVAFSDLGRDLLIKFSQEVSDIATMPKDPELRGRYMNMMLNPVKTKAEVIAEKARAGKSLVGITNDQHEETNLSMTNENDDDDDAYDVAEEDDDEDKEEVEDENLLEQIVNEQLPDGEDDEDDDTEDEDQVTEESIINANAVVDEMVTDGLAESTANTIAASDSETETESKVSDEGRIIREEANSKNEDESVDEIAEKHNDDLVTVATENSIVEQESIRDPKIPALRRPVLRRPVRNVK